MVVLQIAEGAEVKLASAERFTVWRAGMLGAPNASGKKLAPGSLIEENPKLISLSPSLPPSLSRSRTHSLYPFSRVHVVCACTNVITSVHRKRVRGKNREKERNREREKKRDSERAK